MIEARRADTPPGSRAERSGNVALGISGSSMSEARRADTPLRSRAERVCRAWHQRLVDELGKTSRCATGKQSGAGMSLGISGSSMSEAWSMSEARRADTPPGSRAERSGFVALGISGSSMS